MKETKKISLLLLVGLLMFHSSPLAEGDLLYDVDFGTPPHQAVSQ